MYAIIEDSGVQIKVSQGDVIRVDERPLPAGTGSITFERVLLVGGAEGGGEARIGRPYVEGAKVTAEVLGPDSEKVEVVKFRRRKNYLRRKGHRQHYLKVKIASIQA